MNDDQPRSQSESPIRRRDFIKTTGSVTVAAASWWGITAKADAMEPDVGQLNFGGNQDSDVHKYDYDGGT